MQYRIGFVMEQTLGHVTHAKNLSQHLAADAEVDPVWMPVPFLADDGLDRLPVVRSNWTLRSSLRARRFAAEASRSRELHALFFHTSVTALLAGKLMARTPTIVSMDATPLNFDSIGNSYNHRPSSVGAVEGLKNALNRRVFSRAKRLVTWNHWGKASLVKDYGVDPEKVEVIPPGVDLQRWVPGQGPRGAGRLRLLFVGGDFRRKGGQTLLDAFGRHLKDSCELDIVTREAVDTTGLVNVRVHHGLGPNSPELRELYSCADAFVFPTEGDATPLAVMEALASGLPVVTTAVGALSEQVEDGVTGFVVRPGVPEELASAVRRLIDSPESRRTMSHAARRAAEARYDAATNYGRVLALCKQCAGRN
jgi:glycosyltransferase involved in cell wall biosynthesis